MDRREQTLPGRGYWFQLHRLRRSRGRSPHPAAPQNLASKPSLTVRGRTGVIWLRAEMPNGLPKAKRLPCEIPDIVDIERNAEPAEIEPGAELAFEKTALPDIEGRADAQPGPAHIADRAVDIQRDPCAIAVW